MFKEKHKVVGQYICISLLALDRYRQLSSHSPYLLERLSHLTSDIYVVAVDSFDCHAWPAVMKQQIQKRSANTTTSPYSSCGSRFVQLGFGRTPIQNRMLDRQKDEC
ncbi:hypothetical protein OUZ56_028568 [Daphnia magna]|uniref:Uncharacterized protein n=1 Tax=Daphnia magna TaxID=35525 RepID=A0ABR0B490_9CRUS|nr:hypothetical protein OUZ56_028568 [Daphnia magna]